MIIFQKFLIYCVVTFLYLYVTDPERIKAGNSKKKKYVLTISVFSIMFFLEVIEWL